MGLTNEYKHTIFFSDLTEQREFFEGKVTKTFTDYAYARKNWELKVGASFATASSWSYLFFKNPNDAKTYYYFINDVQYISDNTVKLVIELDVMQTYMFDYNLSGCFVEREHTATDQIGDNTVEEDLELGQLVNNTYNEVPITTSLCIMVMSTVDIRQSNFPNVRGSMCDGIFTGCDIYAIPAVNADVLVNRLNALDTAGKSDAIVTIWVYPHPLVEYEDGDFSIKRVTGIKPEGIMQAVNVPTMLDGYTPKNNKLFTYPFSYLYASNNSGNSAIYRYERFTNTPYFQVRGSIYPDGGALLVPMEYNGSSQNYDEGFSLGAFPTCSWNADAYKIWLAQNQSQHKLAQTSGVVTAGLGAVTAIAGLATGNLGTMAGGIGGATGGIYSIASLMAQKNDMERTPAQARGGTSATLLTCNGQMTFSFYTKSVTAERAHMIDDYFTLYGYAVKNVKVPNRNVRQSFTYTKTVGCHISGNICTADKVKIEKIYDNGITFWNKNVTVGNYNATNKPKSEV